MIIDAKTEQALKHALQRNVTFEVNGKIIREGKLILFNIKDFYITFNIITSKNIAKVYELPVPFQVDLHPTHITFDYRFKHIVRGDKIKQYLITAIHNKFGKKSKLFDDKLTIKFMD